MISRCADAVACQAKRRRSGCQVGGRSGKFQGKQGDEHDIQPPRQCLVRFLKRAGCWQGGANKGAGGAGSAKKASAASAGVPTALSTLRQEILDMGGADIVALGWTVGQEAPPADSNTKVGKGRVAVRFMSPQVSTPMAIRNPSANPLEQDQGSACFVDFFFIIGPMRATATGWRDI